MPRIKHVETKLDINKMTKTETFNELILFLKKINLIFDEKIV